MGYNTYQAQQLAEQQAAELAHQQEQERQLAEQIAKEETAKAMAAKAKAKVRREIDQLNQILAELENESYSPMRILDKTPPSIDTSKIPPEPSWSNENTVIMEVTP